MCLYTNWKKAKISIFPKIRYKILNKSGDFYFTPFQIVKVTPSSNSIFKAMFFAPTSYDRIVKYGIHTYKSKKMAKEQLKNLYWDDCVMFKVKIPRGTLYFDGYDDWKVGSSCSEKIQFIKRIL